MKKSLTRLFLLFMVFIFIFSAFGCEEDITKGKEVIPFEETGIYEIYNEKMVFDSCNELEVFVANEPFFEDSFYFIINTEAFFKRPTTVHRNPPKYTFKYNEKVNDEYLETQIMVAGIFTDENAPKEKKGCTIIKNGSIDWTCGYAYYAYPTKEIDTPLTFKHVVILDKSNVSQIVIQVCQGENTVGYFSYVPDKYDDEYYENFLKENLIIIGGNSSET